MPGLGENSNYESVINTEGTVVDSSENSDTGDITEFNNNPELAEQKANEIVEGLPDTLNQLSPEQQEQFISIVGPSILNMPEFVDTLPNNVPKTWVNQLHLYKDVRGRASMLPPDKLAQIQAVEKDAIQIITKDVSDIGLA